MCFAGDHTQRLQTPSKEEKLRTLINGLDRYIRNYDRSSQIDAHDKLLHTLVGHVLVMACLL